jgi:four helix bundle protein
MSGSVLRLKSYAFSIEVVNVVRLLQKEKREYVLSKQLIRSGTAIGALIAEAEFGQSKADFIHKMYIALKEANETRYWLNLLYDTQFIEKSIYQSRVKECTELVKLLVSTIKTSKQNLR